MVFERMNSFYLLLFICFLFLINSKFIHDILNDLYRSKNINFSNKMPISFKIIL